MSNVNYCDTFGILAKGIKRITACHGVRHERVRISRHAVGPPDPLQSGVTW